MIDVVKNLNEINKLEQEIYQSFDYQINWRVYPLDNNCDSIWLSTRNNIYWHLDEESFLKAINDLDKDYILSLNELDLMEFIDDECLFNYSNILVKDVGKSKCGKYTAFIADTQCDHNIFFSIFENSKNYLEIIKKI